MAVAYCHDARVLLLHFFYDAKDERSVRMFKMKQHPKATGLQWRHNLAMEGVDEYSDFLSLLEDRFTQKNEAEDRPLSLPAEFESYADEAVRGFLETIHDLSDDTIGQEGVAVALVTKTGLITQMNPMASQSENLFLGRYLADCDVQFDGNTDLETLFSEEEKNDSASIHLIHAKGAFQNSSKPLQVSRYSKNKDAPLFLITFVNSPDLKTSIQVFAQKFEWTPVETEIACAFLEGAALRDIADQRGRSYVTIRNQFQKVLEKSECNSQTEFFRTAFSLMAFMQNKNENSTQTETSAKSSKLMLPRPSGRVLEVILNGDLQGKPILNLTSLFGQSVTPEIGQKLHDRSFLLITVMRPGFGSTSKPANLEDQDDCFAADVAAVLASMGIDKCVCLARATAALPFYRLLQRLPDRVSHGVVVNGVVPRNYIPDHSIRSKWAASVMKAYRVSVPAAKLMLATGNSLFSQFPRAFLKNMYQTSNLDIACFDDDGIIMAAHEGIEQLTRQGLDASLQEMANVFQNWGEDLRGITTPITLYHGAHDPLVPIESVRQFSKDNAHCMQLVEEPQGGGLLSFTHSDTVLRFTESTL